MTAEIVIIVKYRFMIFIMCAVTKIVGATAAVLWKTLIFTCKLDLKYRIGNFTLILKIFDNSG